MKKIIAFIFILLFSAFVPLKSSVAGWSDGRDDNDDYYFPADLAKWCDMDTKAATDKRGVEKCFTTVCSDYLISDFVTRRVNKKRFQQFLLHAWANALIMSIEAKKQYANDVKFDKADTVMDDAGTDIRTQMTGNTEIVKELGLMKNDLNRLKQVLADLDFYSLLESNCDLFAIKQNAKTGEKE